MREGGRERRSVAGIVLEKEKEVEEEKKEKEVEEGDKVNRKEGREMWRMMVRLKKRRRLQALYWRRKRRRGKRRNR